MKVALVNTLYAPYQVGGAERAVQLLAEGLSRRGHSVCVITLGEAALGCRSVIGGVTVHRLALDNWYWPYSGARPNATKRAAWHLRDFDNAAMSARVASILEQAQPDVLHTNTLAGFSVGIWREAARRRMPVVHTVHDYYLLCPPSAMYRNGADCERICPRCLPFAVYRKRASETVQAVVGVSRFILERHLRAGLFRRSGTAKVIFNSAPAAHGEAPRDRNGALVFGFIGRLCAEKGVCWLLETFTRHARLGDRLLVAGKGEPAFVEALKARFSSPCVSFVGHVEPAVFYRQVDVVVVPSLWHEPFGRVVIEAFAHGIPVIASRRGGLAEIVEDGVTGMLVDPHEPDSLARAMRRLCADPDLTRRLSRNGAWRVRGFSEESVIDAYAGLFAAVVARAPR